MSLDPSYITPGLDFNRDTNYIEDRITQDGRDGWPVEPGRYRLVAARACPWANRTTIVRRLLGLEGAISLGLPGPTHDVNSWTFDLDPDGRDPVLGIERSETPDDVAGKDQVAPSRQEPGNLRWDIWEEAGVPGRFILDELYKDESAVAAHRETPHFQHYLSLVETLALRQAHVVRPLEVAIP